MPARPDCFQKIFRELNERILGLNAHKHYRQSLLLNIVYIYIYINLPTLDRVRKSWFYCVI